MSGGLEGIGTEHTDPHHVDASFDEEQQRWYEATYAGSRENAEYERARLHDMRSALSAIDSAGTHDPQAAVRAVGDLLTAISMILEMGNMEAEAQAEASAWLGLTGDGESTESSSPFWQHVFEVRYAGQHLADRWERHQAVETNYFIVRDQYEPGQADAVIAAARECRGAMQL